MAKRKPIKLRKTKAVLPADEHTIVDVLPESARNNFHERGKKKTTKTPPKKPS